MSVNSSVIIIRWKGYPIVIANKRRAFVASRRDAIMVQYCAHDRSMKDIHEELCVDMTMPYQAFCRYVRDAISAKDMIEFYEQQARRKPTKPAGTPLPEKGKKQNERLRDDEPRGITGQRKSEKEALGEWFKEAKN